MDEARAAPPWASWAALFYRSGWTQEELAAKEGKSRQRITQMLLFGRFLNFATGGSNSQIPPNLTERHFRSFWERTSGDERDRFSCTKVVQHQVVIQKDVKCTGVVQHSVKIRSRLALAARRVVGQHGDCTPCQP